MRVISAAVGMYDIMERKVTLVESLGKKRAPFPDMGALYLLEPSEESINRMLEDFVAGKVLYGTHVFIYTLGRLSDKLLDKIKACRPLLKRLKALSEVNIDFLAKEERAFILDMQDSFNTFYLRKGVTPIERTVADRLVTACATLNEYPHIRFRQSSAICNSLAAVFHIKMDEFVAQNPTWWYHGGPAKGQQTAMKERGTLLLVDRADDCLTPLMHDYTYQAMVHDLIPMDGDRITYQSETTDDVEQTEAKDVLLDERDNLWVELRGKHIAQVIETLSGRIRDITSSSTGSSLGKEQKGNMSLSQMAAALKALPEYREVMSKLSQHMHIAHTCMDALKKDNLMELSELEQTLATGKDDEGRSVKLADLMDKAESLIMNMKSTKERLRLILIVTISQGGLRQQDRRRLCNAAELTRKDTRTLNSLEVLGLSLFSSGAGTEKKKSFFDSLTG
jgi:syntaxin-binding protein 1